MKKSVVKLMATCLAFILLISVAPTSVFAAEETISPQAFKCTHPGYYVTITGRSESCGSSEYHNSYEIELSTCVSCGASFETIVSVTKEAHIVENWNLISYDDDYFYYEGECKYCGDELVLILSRA